MHAVHLSSKSSVYIVLIPKNVTKREEKYDTAETSLFSLLLLFAGSMFKVFLLPHFGIHLKIY